MCVIPSLCLSFLDANVSCSFSLCLSPSLFFFFFFLKRTIVGIILLRSLNEIVIVFRKHLSFFLGDGGELPLPSLLLWP